MGSNPVVNLTYWGLASQILLNLTIPDLAHSRSAWRLQGAHGTAPCTPMDALLPTEVQWDLAMEEPYSAHLEAAGGARGTFRIVGGVFGHYGFVQSIRSASTGLARIARHAGTNDATSDTPTRTAGAAMNVAGSSGETA